MKKIEIHQENSDIITLSDEDSTDINSYSNEITKVLESSKVCIIETTSGSIIVRPSKINSIFVTEILESNPKKDNKIKKEKVENKVKEDVIRD